MGNRKQRKQWAAHHRDELRAIGLQQVAAGGTHSPVEGPTPYSRDEMAAAVHDAVTQERERCGAVADAVAAQPDLLPAVVATARRIAAAIRADVD